jgi:Domain of unknown function (DUF4062)
MSNTKVLISSTARDLPEHRKEVMDACLRQGMFPTMMEHLPAADADAISESLRMVDGRISIWACLLIATAMCPKATTFPSPRWNTTVLSNAASRDDKPQ